MVKKSNNFLGSGVTFPFKLDDFGNISFSYYEKSLSESIDIILRTSKGERVMRPDFGCEINDMVFAPNNSNTRSLICHYIEEALIRWEPRIVLEKVEAFPSSDNEARIDIVINYKVRSINSAFNKVYPFYLERGESDTNAQLG